MRRIAWIIGLFVLTAPAYAVKVADITRIGGQRSNTLTGLGLIYGLKGTGDGGAFLPAIRPLAAMLSKFSGGIGIAYHRVRARGSLIQATNGHSSGIVPWLKTLDSSVAAVNQGGKRKGACCVYLEPWHADIEEFLELRKNTGDDRRRTHDMNTANWIPDLFLERVEGYGIQIMKGYNFDKRDIMWLFSHSGINNVNIDVALESKKRGMKVIAYGSALPTAAKVCAMSPIFSLPAGRWSSR